MLLDLTKPITQAEFGDLIGIGRPTVSDLVTRGVLTAGDSAHAWLLAYCRRLREQAAGRASDGDLDLVQERAALARSQREAQEIKNAALRGQYAPVSLLEDVLAGASAAVVDRLDGVEGLLQRVSPDLPEATRAALLQTISSARNDWVRATAQLVTDILDEVESEESAETADEGPP